MLSSGLKCFFKKMVPSILALLVVIVPLSCANPVAPPTKEPPPVVKETSPAVREVSDYAEELNLLAEVIHMLYPLNSNGMDANEKMFVEVLAKNENLQNQKLSFLTEDAKVSNKELEFINQSQHLNYLIDDLYGLPEILDGIDPKDVTATEQIVNLMKSDDPEVQQGLTLVAKYGVPPTTIFGRSQGIPNHNTQLQVLFWQVDNIDTDYDRVTLALALVYGSVVTIGNDEVDQKVKGYVSEIYDYIKETDKILEERNLSWKAKDYPLEACISLVYGANNVRYPYFYEYIGAVRDHPWQHYWRDEFRARQLNIEDFNWLFASKETKQELQDWMFAKFTNTNTNINGISQIAQVSDVYQSKHREYITDHPDVPATYLEVNGKITPGCRISNPDWQWSYFKEKSKFIGNCDDGSFMECMLLSSINISAFKELVHSETDSHYVILYPEDDILKTTSHQLNHIKKYTTGLIQYKTTQIPWNNFYNQEPFMHIIESSDKMLLQKGIHIEEIYKF